MSSYYRVAGLSYLQYLTKCTSAARAVVKESVKVKYESREQFHFIKSTFVNNKAAEKVTNSNILKAK